MGRNECISDYRNVILKIMVGMFADDKQLTSWALKLLAVRLKNTVHEVIGRDMIIIV